MVEKERIYVISAYEGCRVMALRRKCGPDEKVVFYGRMPEIVRKNWFDLLCDRIKRRKLNGNSKGNYRKN